MKITSTAIFVLLTTLAACSTLDNGQQAQEQKLRAAIISVKHNSIPVARQASFHWKDDHIRIYHSNPILNQANLDVMLKQAIENELIAKGYSFEPNNKHPQFVIAFAAALDSDLDNDEIQARYGLQPGLIEKNSNIDHYEKGTVIFDIIDGTSDRLIWRSAGQAMATMKQIPVSERQQRVNQFIEQLLNELPQAIE